MVSLSVLAFLVLGDDLPDALELGWGRLGDMLSERVVPARVVDERRVLARAHFQHRSDYHDMVADHLLLQYPALGVHGRAGEHLRLYLPGRVELHAELLQRGYLVDRAAGRASGHVGYQALVRGAYVDPELLRGVDVAVGRVLGVDVDGDEARRV